MPKCNIPDDIGLDHYTAINKLLRDICGDLGADLVNSRLNRSEVRVPAPVFVGWVESKKLREKRQKLNFADPGLLRFGGGNWSKVYADCIDLPDRVHARDWKKQLGEKTAEALALDAKTGVYFRRYVAMKVDNRQ